MNNLAEIQKLVKNLESYINNYSSENSIPTIEIDILLQKTRELYDVLIQEKQQSIDTITDDVIEKVFEEPINETPAEEILFTVDEEPIQAITEEQKTIEETPSEVIEQNIEDKPIETSKPRGETKTEIEIISETTTEQQTNETISTEEQSEIYIHKQANDLGSKLGQKPISDILSALGINDRYLYRSRLFNNNQEEFLKSINILNDSKDFASALTYIKTHFHWDFENQDVQSFLSIVERRFL